MKFICRKHLGKLVPVDSVGEAALAKIPHGSEIMIELKRSRNIKHHRLYFALLGLVFENQDRYETTEQLHNALKIAAGIYEPLEMPGGVIHKIPGSIAFDTMDQTEFSAFFDRVCDLVAKHFLPGVTADILKHEIEVMIGAKAA